MSPSSPRPRLSGGAGAARAGTILVALVVLVALLGVGAVLLRRPTGPTLLLIGDSITAGAQPQLENELGGDHQLTIDGRSGWRIDEMVPAAQEHAAAGPSAQVVMNLGTNDVNQ